MEQTYAEYLEERGEKRGERTGAQRSLREALKMVLTERFGPIPSDVEAIIAEADLDKLADWPRIAATAPNLQTVGIAPSE